MAEDTILQPISLAADHDIRSASKTSGLFNSNEILNEIKDESLKDFQTTEYDQIMAADFNYNSLFPMPFYEMPQDIQANAELDIPKPSVLDDSEWDLGSFDAENNIDCNIFAELSDLATTTVMVTDEVSGGKQELTTVASKPSGSGEATVIMGNLVPELSVMRPAPRDVAISFLDHSYAAIVAKNPAMHPEVKDTCVAPCDRGDVGEIVVSKATKYVERRKKNNLASRRSRETRKRKYVEMQEEVFRLERNNAELRNRIAKMEWMSGSMKRSLFGKIDVPGLCDGIC